MNKFRCLKTGQRGKRKEKRLHLPKKKKWKGLILKNLDRIYSKGSLNTKKEGKGRSSQRGFVQNCLGQAERKGKRNTTARKHEVLGAPCAERSTWSFRQGEEGGTAETPRNFVTIHDLARSNKREKGRLNPGPTSTTTKPFSKNFYWRRDEAKAGRIHVQALDVLETKGKKRKKKKQARLRQLS